MLTILGKTIGIKVSINFMLSQFCEREEDIQVYGNTWIIDITKKCDYCADCNVNREAIELLLNDKTRNEEQILACCSTCNRYAVAAATICGCLSIPALPITS